MVSHMNALKIGYSEQHHTDVSLPVEAKRHPVNGHLSFFPFFQCG